MIARLQFSDGFLLQIRIKLYSQFFGENTVHATPVGLFTYKNESKCGQFSFRNTQVSLQVY